MVILKNEYLVVEIKQKGAEVIKVNSISGTKFMHDGKTDWFKTSPVLFPYCGNLNDSKFIYDDKVFIQNTQHGFARDMDFDLVRNNDISATFKLSENEESLKRYPFKFNFYITYTLSKNSLEVRFLVENKNDYKMYFGIGAHPAFNIIEDGLNINDWYLEFEKDEILKNLVVENKLVTDRSDFILDGRILEFNMNTFNNDSLMFEKLNSSYVVLKNRVNSKEVIVSMKDFPYLLVWSTPGDSSFICIEPWVTCPSYFDDSLEINKKKSIIEIDVNDSFEITYEITFNS